MKADYILALEEKSNGDIYIGTHSGGLSIIKKNGEIINYPIEGGKSGILIFNLHILDDNSIWIATNIGIYKFNGIHCSGNNIVFHNGSYKLVKKVGNLPENLINKIRGNLRIILDFE